MVRIKPISKRDLKHVRASQSPQHSLHPESMGGDSVEEDIKLYDILRENSVRRKIVQSQDYRLKHLLQSEHSTME
jgi:hypothetical protein